MAPWHSIPTEYCRKQRDSQPSIEKFTPDGVGTVFADGADGLASPFGLAFDTAGNLYVSNGTGGPTHTGSVLKFAPDGVGSMFADTGLDFPFGLAFDRAGNLYVSNYNSNTIEEFSPTGEDLGVFAYTGGGPHFMAMFRPRQLHIESEAIESAGKVSGLRDSKRSKRERTRLHTEKHQLTSIATSYDVAICLALLHISLFALKAIL